MGEQEEENFNSSELYKLFPFLEAFPFTDYEIALERDEFNPRQIGIDPIIINNVSGLEAPDMINFFYFESDSQVMISFYRSDIDFIREESIKIKSLDPVLKNLNEGLESDLIKDKIKSIKKADEFVKQIIPDMINDVPFGDVLIEMLTINNVTLDQKLLTQVQKKSAYVKDEKFSEFEKEVIRAFYNFQLHHAKILLGMVIAAKIY